MPTVSRIHKSAIIDSQAQLADDVEIGPNCVIEGAVTIGAGTRLIGHVWLIGPLTLGRSNLLYPNVSLGFEPQSRRYVPGTGSGVRIGDDNVLREGVTIHRATGDTPTTVGNGSMLMCNSHLGHDAVIGERCTLANGALLAGHVTLGDDVMMGGISAVHQFCRMGRLSMISGGSITVQDVPPFCTVYNTSAVGSLNIVGLRRAGYRQHIPNLNRAFDILFKQRHTLPNTAGQIERDLAHDPLCAEFAAFLRTSKRGITHYEHAGDAEA